MGHGVCGGLRPEQRSYASVNSKRSAFLERVSKPVSRPSRCGHRWATLGVPKGRSSFAVAMPADSEAVLKHALRVCGSCLGVGAADKAARQESWKFFLRGLLPLFTDVLEGEFSEVRIRGPR